MYRTIIVPVDLSQEQKGRDILARALILRDSGARIVLVNVVEPIPGHIANELPAGLLDASRHDAADKLRTIASDAGIDAHVEVRTGHPANEILELAQEQDADLIIVGSHRPGLQDYFIGSTASRVVRHALCSVLVTR